MIHRFVDLLEEIDVTNIVWNITRVTGGTTRTIAAAGSGQSTLATYLNSPLVSVNQFILDYPDLSPDLQWYVYTKQDNSSPFNDAKLLMLAPLDDSGSAVQIAQSPNVGSSPYGGTKWLVPAGWTSDSSQIYYLATDNETDDDLMFRRVDIDGSNDTLILDTGITDLASGVLPRLSPDDSKIAYWLDTDAGSGSRGLWVMNADGSGNTRILTTAVPDSPMDFYGWSRDSEWLTVLHQVSTTRRLYKVRPDGSDLTAMFEDTTAAGNLVTMFPTISQHSLWTPDGSQIAVRRNNFSPSANAPVLLDTDGSESYTALPVGSMGTYYPTGGVVLNHDGSRAYWVEGGTLDGTWVMSCLIDGSDVRIDDDMTDSSTSPNHDDFLFNGFCKTIA